MKCFDYQGNEFKSIIAMCEHYGISRFLYTHRRSKGLTLEQCLQKVSRYRVFDHLGNEFNTKKEMCEHYGISFSTFSSRMEAGWTLKNALTVDIKTTKLIKVFTKKESIVVGR